LQGILSDSCIKRSTIVTGLDFYLTEPGALRKLINLGAEVLIYVGNREFHPKFYLVRCSDGREYLIVGSANISRGAIVGENIEVSTLIGSYGDVIVKAKKLIKEIRQLSVNAKAIIREYEEKRNRILTYSRRLENKPEISSLNLKPIDRALSDFRRMDIDVTNNGNLSISSSSVITNVSKASQHEAEVKDVEALGETIHTSVATISRDEHIESRTNLQKGSRGDVQVNGEKGSETKSMQRQRSESLKEVLLVGRDIGIEIDTYDIFHVNIERAKAHITQLLCQLVKYGLLELPKNVGEKKTINFTAKVYIPIPRAYEKLKRGQANVNVVKCMRVALGKQYGSRKRKAFWEALRLLLIVFRYGIKVSKKRYGKDLALAREYSGAFKSRDEKNRFALKLVKCLEKEGLIEISGNFAMSNLRKLAELGFYEITWGKVSIRITKANGSAYKIRLELLEPFKLQQPRIYIIPKDDFMRKRGII